MIRATLSTPNMQVVVNSAEENTGEIAREL
eukprot:SAG31_NODE_36666_length_311_cov_0.957547_1_plen_29_part_01